jgi:FMN-dependent NADH-azoreductase
MKTLLKIQASLAGSAAQSTQLADRVIEQWLRTQPRGQVVTRDLALDAIPHLTGERFQSFLSAPHERTTAQQQVVAFSDGLIQELQEADVILLAVPMYNFGIPSTLRAYFDHIARAGVTFHYTDSGAEGLIKGKKTYVIVTRGGRYDAEADTQTAYLRQFLGFIGLTDLEFVYAEGLSMGPEAREEGLANARAAIDRLALFAQAA